MLKRCMIVCAAIDCLGICKIPALSIIGDFNLENEAALVAGVTGLRIDVDSLLEAGERTIQMERLLNLNFGATAEDDQLPAHFEEEPVEKGFGKEIKVADLIKIKQSFYRLMGWNSKGVPTVQTLEKFGINFSKRY